MRSSHMETFRLEELERMGPKSSRIPPCADATCKEVVHLGSTGFFSRRAPQQMYLSRVRGIHDSRDPACESALFNAGAHLSARTSIISQAISSGRKEP